LAVRLFVGNLAYSTTEADLRTYFGAVAPPSQVVLPVDRETGRPRGFAFVEFIDRAHAEQAIKQFNGQPYNGRPLAVSEARAREDRGPGGPRPGGYSSGPRPAGGGFAPSQGGFGGPTRTFDGGGSRRPAARQAAAAIRPRCQAAARRQRQRQQPAATTSRVVRFR
jgi:RNA recognition motif-containing protein